MYMYLFFRVYCRLGSWLKHDKESRFPRTCGSLKPQSVFTAWTKSIKVENKYASPMQEGQRYNRLQLSPNSEEFKRVEGLFRVTMSAEKTAIIKIELVENADHWRKFILKRELMQNKGLERELFHGTQPNTVSKICKENFDPRLSGANGTLYGQGSYFAVNASYSDKYAQHKGQESRFMFLAYVLVGSYTKGNPAMKRPPPKNPHNADSDLFDSCVDNETNPTIFVIFERDHCYPAYIIEYSTQPELLPPLRGKGPDPVGIGNVFHERNSVQPLPSMQSTGVSNFELSRLPSTSPDLFGPTATSSRTVLPAIPSSSLSKSGNDLSNALSTSHMVFNSGATPSPPIDYIMQSASGHVEPYSGAVPSAPPPSPPLGSRAELPRDPHDNVHTVTRNVSPPFRCCCIVVGTLIILASAYLILHFFVVDKAMRTKSLQL